MWSSSLRVLSEAGMGLRLDNETTLSAEDSTAPPPSSTDLPQSSTALPSSSSASDGAFSGRYNWSDLD